MSLKLGALRCRTEKRNEITVHSLKVSLKIEFLVYIAIVFPQALFVSHIIVENIAFLRFDVFQL